MDWLSPYHAVLDCHAKTVTLSMLGLPRLEWKGSTVDMSSRVISFLKACHMVEKGCLAYLDYVWDTTAESPTIDLVPVVRDIADVFPSNLPGMPPDRDIDFFIDLAPGTQPISIPPYRMVPKELKEQLEESLVKGLTQKGAPFRWYDDYEASFQELETALTTTLVLVLPSGSGMYTAYCDSSGVGLGCVLMQEGQVIAYFHRDLNLRQHRWLELLKDYDITILYHPGKENVVAFALSRKVESMGSLVFIPAEERPLALDIQSLANRLVRLDISEPSRVLACVVGQSSLLGQIKARQFDDPHLAVLRETMLQGSAKEFSIGEDGVLRLQGHLCVPNVDGLMERILEEAHSSWLTKSVHFIPVMTTYTSERLPQIYIREIVRLHGVPVSIVLDIGPQFTSHFWRAIQSELGTHIELSTTFHPQIDDQSERTVQILEYMLRACVIDFGG
ncbi:uncharacterized protein [Nicotiana sylvestris]|uniref:uncharacterized protein n=1 Tax=Nicotiana sylvestris TaxID=4096 RepID=UPI00388C42E2